MSLKEESGEAKAIAGPDSAKVRYVGRCRGMIRMTFTIATTLQS